MSDNRWIEYLKEFLGLFFSHPHSAIVAFFCVDFFFVREILAILDGHIVAYFKESFAFEIQYVDPSFIVASVLFIGFYKYVMRWQGRVVLEFVNGESHFYVKVMGFDARQSYAYGARAFIVGRRSNVNGTRSVNDENGVPSPFLDLSFPEEFSFSQSLPFAAEVLIPEDFRQVSPQSVSDIDSNYSIFVTLRVKGEFLKIEKRLAMNRGHV